MRGRRERAEAVRRRGTTAAPRRLRRLRAATALAAVITLTGCADVGGAGRPVTPGGTQTVTDDAVDATLPLLQIERSGGYVLVGTDFATVPELTVYAGGEAITHGPQILIHPPPTLPNLLRHELGDADVDALVAAAREAGLLGDVPDYGRPPVADAPTTFVTLRVGGREYVHSAEALGIGDDAPDGLAADDAVGPEAAVPDERLPGDDLATGLTEPERAARAALAAFVTRAHRLVGTAGDGEPYDIDAFAVMAQPAPDGAPTDPAAAEDPAGTMPAPDDGLERTVVAWPLDLALADATDCVVVDGEPAGTLRDVLAGTSWTTLYEQGGVRYDVWFRPLLPHEDGCDGR